MITRLKAVTLLGAFIWLASAVGASAQSLSYNSGQSVAPAGDAEPLSAVRLPRTGPPPAATTQRDPYSPRMEASAAEP